MLCLPLGDERGLYFFGIGIVMANTLKGAGDNRL
jgi:hypothetical protein